MTKTLSLLEVLVVKVGNLKQHNLHYVPCPIDYYNKELIFF